MSKPDINYRSYADQDNFTVAGETIQADDPAAYDDILKVSHCQYAIVRDCAINLNGGNREDGVDVMRSSYAVHFNECEVGAGQLYAFTIKGGSDMISLRNVLITRPGPWPQRVDIDIGNYSSTVPNAKTGTILLTNVTRTDGKPVRVRVGWAARPIISGGNVKVLFWQSLALKVYVWVMRKFFS
jgi:hypothetical protein